MSANSIENRSERLTTVAESVQLQVADLRQALPEAQTVNPLFQRVLELSLEENAAYSPMVLV